MRFRILFLLFGLNLAAAHAETFDLKHSFAIVVGETTIVADADIVEYRFAEHALRIRGESLLRLSRMRPSVSGTTFHVVVDGERVYAGRFISPASSMTYKEPTILVEQPILTQAGTNQAIATILIRGPSYGEPQYQPGTDPRVDARLTRALGALGKLTAGVAGGASNEMAFSTRVADILKECQGIKPGMSRAELAKVFTTEGGISNAKHRTFVYRGCPYIKVDVEFALTKSKQGVVEEQPTDIISKISKPYLEWSSLD